MHFCAFEIKSGIYICMYLHTYIYKGLVRIIATFNIEGLETEFLHPSLYFVIPRDDPVIQFSFTGTQLAVHSFRKCGKLE